MRQIETDRLILRRYKYTDWLDLHDFLSDSEVVMFESYDPYDCNASKSECRRRAKNKSHLAVGLRDGGRIIGNVYCARDRKNVWNVGCMMNREFWGLGYAKEALRAVIDDAFDHRGAKCVTARCSPCNDRAVRLLNSLGMRCSCELIQNVWFKKDSDGNPIWNDTCEYVVTRDEWRSGIRDADEGDG